MAGPSSVPLIRYDLAYYSVVTQILSPTSFRAAGLVGQGDGTFQGYYVHVLTKIDRTTNPPHSEKQLCAGYVSATGQISHPAFTATLSVGDSVLLIHPSIGHIYSLTIDSFPGSITQNWQAAAQTVTTVGALGVINKVHSLMLDINALVGNITVRLLTNINAVQRQVYTQTLSVALDGPGLWIINGGLAIQGLLLVTAQSDNAADNGQPIGWQYILETT